MTQQNDLCLRAIQMFLIIMFQFLSSLVVQSVSIHPNEATSRQSIHPQVCEDFLYQNLFASSIKGQMSQNRIKVNFQWVETEQKMTLPALHHQKSNRTWACELGYKLKNHPLKSLLKSLHSLINRVQTTTPKTRSFSAQTVRAEPVLILVFSC